MTPLDTHGLLSSWPMAPDAWLVPALVLLATAAVVLYQR